MFSFLNSFPEATNTEQFGGLNGKLGKEKKKHQAKSHWLTLIRKSEKSGENILKALKIS